MDEESEDNIDVNQFSEEINEKNIKDEQNVEKIYKMILKNKINQENAYKVPILNISEYKAFNVQNEEGWKKISTIIETYSKIYGYRVDNVYNETHQILGGLNRHNDNYRKKSKEDRQDEIYNKYQFKDG